ncbi:(4Fe-4S)-binding protein [Methanosarcina sp. KYL-1]|uniref:ATP-binding protein n=1 Tax=Methanosarcina sp. KYL-1 TaxID=2602068 RepID=UPI002100CC0A|nr:ATP-binding protein [Methanosarcina sp. KYL-1]MCQ1534168.1 (4Fe-4S)-binding protein [Methanosarcina sp. KYL-1]
MKVAIASGKGGTGKTTVAVNLALSLGGVHLLDCDVEEPNCNLFLGLELEKLEYVTCQVPEIDPEKCTLCGKCADFCRYNALAALPSRVLVFPALCHGCGGCGLVCTEGAVREKPGILGILESARSDSSLEFSRGVLNVGEAAATPLIRALQRHIDNSRPAIIDSPPGVACPVLAVIGAADYCVLVTESTPFGFHDFRLALEAVKALKVPFGVVLNRDGLGDSRVEEFCGAKGIPILLRIPDDRRIAQLYSEGIPFVEEMPEWKEKFAGMFSAIRAIMESGEGTE